MIMYGHDIRPVTFTEIIRIRHTIDALYESEKSLRDKMCDSGFESFYPAVLSHHHRHALEILWGWEQLRNNVIDLPDSFIDKYSLIETADLGIDRITLIEVYTRCILNQRELPPDET